MWFSGLRREVFRLQKSASTPFITRPSSPTGCSQRKKSLKRFGSQPFETENGDSRGAAKESSAANAAIKTEWHPPSCRAVCARQRFQSAYVRKDCLSRTSLRSLRRQSERRV